MGEKVIPWLFVVQTPPHAAATYHMSLLSGFTAMSITRPDVRAGPTIRNDNAPTVPASNGGLTTSVVVDFF